MTVKISIAIYVSEQGILTEYNGNVKKYQGEKFCNREVKEFLSWLKKDFRSKNVFDLLIFGTDFEKVKEIYNGFNDFEVLEDSDFTLETLEKILLENVNLKENIVLKISNNENEKIFITKKGKQFIRTKEEENFENEILVITNNKKFFKVSSKKSKIVSKKKENLNTVAKDKENLSSIFAKKLKGN